jgi:hypothetical protein
MKWFKKLASGAMAAAMVMLCAPTVEMQKQLQIILR